jgi:hypothetical protein
VATRAAAAKEAADATAAKEAAEEAIEKKKAAKEVAKKKPIEEVVARKMVAEEAAAKKKAAQEAVVKKKVVEEVVVKKAAEEAAPKRKATDEAAVKKKASEEAVKKTKSGVATMSSDPSPASSTRVKRAVAPSGSTPPAKLLFHGSCKPRYATRAFICHFLYHVCDFNLVSLAYNVPSSGRSPPSVGPVWRVQPKLLSTRTPSKPNRMMRLSGAVGSRLSARLLPRGPPRRRSPVVGPRP